MIIVYTISILLIIIFIHELGHFIAARLRKVKVRTFSIGFGKKLYSFHDKYQTEWKICIFPLGGYVSFDKDNSDDENDQKNNDDTIVFDSSPPLSKALIAFAGPLANYLLSFIVIFIVLISYGKMIICPEITQVESNTIAEKFGIVPGDKVVEFNGRNDFLVQEIIEQKNNNISITIEHKNGEKKNLVFNRALGNIGIRFEKVINENISFIDAITEAFNGVISMNYQMINGIFDIILGKNSIEIGGPIKIFQISMQSISKGLKHTLVFISILSINLGFINLLPIPGLDGGHLLIYIIEMIIGKGLNKQLYHRIMQVGYAILILLMVFAISKDIISLFR
ncbi:M50 family metallopeptidase [Lyticum sinuosum]|uniref:RIP metalloprotease RseP n=1 Tax=Lyticum sinuosum TaxID=1332059 RepID=A0AAE5AHP6_9RICK|nr:M50 family metallopeptidase [Lyticum sinuosum]MDZ5760984.1 RIP metalloprotease RseP [Lyticum sinuosum]